MQTNSRTVWRICVGVSLVLAFAVRYHLGSAASSTPPSGPGSDTTGRNSTDVDGIEELNRRSLVSDPVTLLRHFHSIPPCIIHHFLLPLSLLLSIQLTPPPPHSLYGVNPTKPSCCNKSGSTVHRHALPLPLQSIHLHWQSIIITALGFALGYYATVLTIEVLGQKIIQISGFLLTGLFLAILASGRERRA